MSTEKEPLLGASRADARGQQRYQSGPTSSAPIVNGTRSSPEYSQRTARREEWTGAPQGGQILDDTYGGSVGASVVVVSRTPSPGVAVYRVRWYLLFLLSMNGFVQGLIWNTFGPISETCKIVFAWDKSDIALLANWGCISFFLTLFPFNYVIEKWGLRASLLIALFGTTAGCTVRLLPVQPWNARYTMHVGQFLNGLGGPVSMAVPPIFSATWFPPNQRTTATAIGALLNLLGIALSFFVGPAFVAEVPISNITSSLFSPEADLAYPVFSLSKPNISDLTNGTDITPYRSNIYSLMWFEWGLIFALLVAALVYFPNKPLLPPSLSASQPKGELLKGLISIVKVPNFWLVAVPYGICAGCFSTYGTQLNSIFHDNFTQNAAGMLGLIYSCAGIFASFVMAFAADKFAGHFKLFLLILQSIMTAIFTWICLMYVGILPMRTTYLYLAFVIYAVAQTSTIPLFYEATIEAVYPISDSIASCMLTLLNNIFGATYLLIMGIQGIGVEWSNWAMLGVTAVGIPLLLCFKQSYSRLAMDKTGQQSVESEQEANQSPAASIPSSDT